MGLGWRLRQVEPNGRIGVATRLLSTPRFVSITNGEWVDFSLPPSPSDRVYSGPRAISSDSVLFTAFKRIGRGDSSYLVPGGYEVFSLAGRRIAAIASTSPSTEKRSVCIASNGKVGVRALPSEQIQLIDFAPHYSARTLSLRTNRVVQSVSCSADGSVIAVGRWGEIDTYRGDGNDVAPRDVRKIPGKDIRWSRIGGPRLVTIVRGHRQLAHGGTLICFELSSHGDLAAAEKRIPIPEYSEIAAVSDDGRFVAIGTESGDIHVVSIDTSELATLKGHTDSISCLHFSAGSRELVAGDDDNRIAVWPFSHAGPLVYSLADRDEEQSVRPLKDKDGA